MNEPIFLDAWDIIKLIDVLANLDLNKHSDSVQKAYDIDPNKYLKKDIYELLIELISLLSIIKYQLFPKYPEIIKKIIHINTVLKEVEEHHVFLSNN